MKFIVFLLLVYICCTLAINPWTGVASNIPLSDLLNSGWSQCYNAPYGTPLYSVSSITTPCTGTSILLGCRQVGNPNLNIAAYSPRSIVFGPTNTGNAGLPISNGVMWYFTDNFSMGFAPSGETVYRNQCDSNSGANHLCWHTLSTFDGGGYRCGDNNLNGDNAWEKIVLHSNSPFVVMDACTTDANCNNHGLCVSSYQGKGCSCLSGFGGSSSCDTRPSSCPFTPVYTNITKFNPTIGISVANTQLTVAVAATIEQTKYANPSSDDSLVASAPYSLENRIQFGASATPCDYPQSLSSKPWTHTSAGATCVDEWKLTVPWASAIADCGFKDPEGDHTYTQTITASRKYQLPDLGDGVPITRTESITKQVTVVFPTSATVQTDVNVTGPVAVSVNAIITSGYDVVSDSWSVVVKTTTNRPYKLSAPTVASVTGEIFADNRYTNTAGSIAITPVVGCTDNNNPCTQVINLKFSGCQAISGGVVIQTTPVCGGAEGATCPHINGYVTIGLNINNADSCGIVNNIDFSVKTLQAFGDSAVTVPQTQFAASDIAYFGAVVQSTNATLTGFTLRSVCLSLDGGPCQPVVFTVLANAGGMNPVFAINLAQTRILTTETTLKTFKVKATIDVTWANGKRDDQLARVNINSDVGVDLTEQASDDGQVYTAGASVRNVSFVLAAIVLLFALL